MPKNEQNNEDEVGKPLSAYAKYSSIGFQMVVVIGIFTFAGYKIDEAGKHDVKWATAVLALIGVFVALYIVIRSVKN
jgi:ATP synthase protein I